MLIIGSINIFGEYSRCNTIYGIFMLIIGIGCIGAEFNFLIKAGMNYPVASYRIVHSSCLNPSQS